MFLVLRGLYLNQKSIGLVPTVDSPSSDDTSISPITNQPQPTMSLASQLSQHNSADDCWVSFNKNVYDVTTYINLHPGGPGNIVKYCGRDITTAFNTKNMSPSKTHSQAAINILFSLMVKK